ncbi:cytochrome c [Achromobacter aloeverae]|uniref:Cytochrome C n=1 Tax=Achromobacter aloeverae TaxID=1750518 RepID=A0A4Q1HI38_9BURK|nr:cytochrome c [Achromobacter aloeverae]RXN87874.1 cytochrome C [Achromobacter aloeverae]
MRGKTIAATLAGVVALGLAALAVATWQAGIAEIAPPAPTSFSRNAVDRGVRVAAAGDCISCHTARGGPAYAGGTPLRTPFGTLYSSNITPDPDSGIGRWSLTAFDRALRTGVSRDGHLLYPAFPYPHFTHLSDQDVQDLYAYLMTRTPVATRPPDNALSFPYSFRPLLAIWNLLYLPDGPLPPDESRGEAWVRGRYLVEGAGHCAACHTPLNALGAPAADRAYAGAIVDGWEAPALTALAHAPRPWTVDQLAAYLRTGLASEHGAAAGPMRDVTRQLALLPEADVKAMAVYLLDLPGARRETVRQPTQPPTQPPTQQPLQQPPQQPPQPPTPPTASRQALTPAPDARLPTPGATLYASTCASCHDEGAPMMRIGGRPALALSHAATADDPRNAINLVLHGIAQEGSAATPYMPAFGAVLDDAQVAQVLDYMRVQVARRPAWPNLQGAVAAVRKETAAAAPLAQAKETRKP